MTTRPQPRSAIAGIAAFIRRIGAITLSSQAEYQSASGTSSSSRQTAVPALLTTTSSLPKCASAAPTMRSPASASVTSRVSAAAAASPLAAAAHSATASPSAPASRPTSRTEAPSAVSMRAVQRPMPRLAPVTTHALPARPRSIGASLPGLDLVGDRYRRFARECPVHGALAGDAAAASPAALSRASQGYAGLRSHRRKRPCRPGWPRRRPPPCRAPSPCARRTSRR